MAFHPISLRFVFVIERRVYSSLFGMIALLERGVQFLKLFLNESDLVKKSRILIFAISEDVWEPFPSYSFRKKIPLMRTSL
jgi:hypothetical protein